MLHGFSEEELIHDLGHRIKDELLGSRADVDCSNQLLQIEILANAGDSWSTVLVQCRPPLVLVLVARALVKTQLENAIPQARAW